jgi:hypothetical protein
MGGRILKNLPPNPTTWVFNDDLVAIEKQISEIRGLLIASQSTLTANLRTPSEMVTFLEGEIVRLIARQKERLGRKK